MTSASPDLYKDCPVFWLASPPQPPELFTTLLSCNVQASSGNMVSTTPSAYAVAGAVVAYVACAPAGCAVPSAAPAGQGVPGAMPGAAWRVLPVL